MEERIVVICDDDLKKETKKAILEKGIKNFQDGYLSIFKLGLKEFKKGGKVNG